MGAEDQAPRSSHPATSSRGGAEAPKRSTKKKGGPACSLREQVGCSPSAAELRQSGTGDGASPSKSLAWSDFRQPRVFSS